MQHRKRERESTQILLNENTRDEIPCPGKFPRKTEHLSTISSQHWWKLKYFLGTSIYLILSMLTAASLGASKRAASCCLTRCTCNVSSRRGFLATDSCESSVPDLLTCVGISNGALLSMLGHVAVSPFK